MTQALTPIALDLDGAMRAQPVLLQAMDAIVDLTALGEPARLRCGRSMAQRLRRALSDARPNYPGPWVTFFGSGDWHHLTLMLLESLPPRRPFSLVLFDNHPDWSCLPPRYHCGNWVAGAARLRGVRAISILGVDGPDLRPLSLLSAPLALLASGRITVEPWSRSRALAPFRHLRGPGMRPHLIGSCLDFRTLTARGVHASFDELGRRLNGRDVYISVDKDVLTPEGAASDWEQGRMSLDQLVLALGLLRERCTIIGADVCGDRAARPLRGFIKRLDAGRLAGSWRPPTAEENRRNQSANLAILDALGVAPAPLAAGTSTWTHSHG